MEHWDGVSWTVSDDSPGHLSTTPTLDAVLAFTPTNVHAIGNGYDSSGAAADRSTTSGTAPSGRSSRPDSTRPTAWCAASATTPEDVAVGDSGEQTFAAHWDGLVWKAATTPTPRSKYAYFNSASMSGSNDAWAVGLYRVGTHRYCLIEHWDGRKWRQVAS